MNEKPPSRLSAYIAPFRPWSLTATVIPIGLGGTLAATDNFSFRWGLFAAMMLCGCCLQTTTNLFNDYADAKRGVDAPGRFAISMRAIRLAGWSFLIVGALLAVGIVLASTPRLLYIAGLGILCAASYTTRFFKYAGLGVPAVFFLMGPLETGAAYLALTGVLPARPLILSLPVACLVASILHGNDLRDLSHDASVGIRTFSLIIGERAARVLDVTLTLLPFALLLAFGFSGLESWTAALIPFLTLPLAFHLVSDVIRRQRAETYIHQSGRLHFLLGALMMASLLADKFFK